MKISALFCLLALTSLPTAPAADPAPPEQFSSSFNKPFRTPRQNLEKFPQQKITGLLAMPWNDDSSWCDLEVEYSQLRENPGEGDLSQRVVVTRLPKGSRAQFGLNDFPLLPGQDIRLRFLAKSPDYTPVTLTIQQRQPPYTSYFTQRIQPGAEWREYEILIPGEFDDANTQLLFNLEQTGIFDLDHFRSERRTSSVTSLAPERLANLLPSSAFPLGAAPPWVAHGFSRAETGELKGPTGVPALELDVRKQPGFARFEQSLSVAFRAAPGKPVTVRVSADLLEGEAEIALRAGVEKIWEPPFGTAMVMQKGWKTYEHTVELPRSPRGYYMVQIAFEGTAKVAIDRIQVSQDGAPFALTGPVELAMDATEPYGLFVGEEPFTIRLAAWGNLAVADSILLTLSDIHGQTREIGHYPVPESPFQAVSAQLPSPAGLPTFGTFRLEAQALNKQKQPVGIPAELLLHRIHPPHFADSPAPDSPFGIHYYTSHLDETGLTTLKKLGFNWLRLFKTFSWKRIEARQGEFDFSQADQDVALLKKHHFLALGILGDGAPMWAAKNPDPNFRGWVCWTPRDPDDFTNFVGKVFERYGDSVTAFEPWNEPYYPGFFTERIENEQRVIGPAEDYLTIQKKVFELARASGKPIRIGWNTNAMEEMPRNRELIALGILPYVDFVSLHHYLGKPDPAPEIHRQVEQMIESMGDEKRPFWNSEGGLGPFTMFNFYRHVPPFQDPNHHLLWAEWYVRYYLACLSSGVEKYFLYLFSAPNFWLPDYSINNIDGRISPNLTAISALAWQIQGTRFVETLSLPDGSQAMLFSGPDRHIACILPHPARPRKPLQTPSVSTYDLFGNPVSANSSPLSELHYLRSASSLEDLQKLLQREN